MKITDTERLDFIQKHSLHIQPRLMPNKFDWHVYSGNPHGIESTGANVRDAIDYAIKSIKEEQSC